MKKIAAGIGGGLLSLALLCAVIRLLCTASGLMARNIRAVTASEETGLPDAETEGVSRMITEYLSGNEPVFQYVFVDDEGISRRCFNEKEQSHMADCRALVTLDGRITLIALAAAGLLSCLFLRKETGKPFRIGLWLVPALAGGIAVFAAVDFSGAFLVFHRLAFENENWLLSRKTDLLIRLMPTAFFIRYALEGLALWFAAVLIGDLILKRGMKHAKKCSDSGAGKLV